LEFVVLCKKVFQSKVKAEIPFSMDNRVFHYNKIENEFYNVNKWEICKG
jgi:hypothetical protein